MEKIKQYVEKITNGEVLLSDSQLDQFEQYYEMLVEKNKVMNLTAITEREEVILKHFIDSLAIAGYVKLWEKTYKIIDVICILPKIWRESNRIFDDNKL